MAKKYKFFLNFAQNSPTLAKHCQIWKHCTYKFCSSWSREPKRERQNDLLPERRNWLLPHDCRGEGISVLAFLAFGALVLTLGPRSILFFRFLQGNKKSVSKSATRGSSTSNRSGTSKSSKRSYSAESLLSNEGMVIAMDQQVDRKS